jgi:ribosomal protein S18 acetylase RimI-like enzyme
MYTIHDIDFNSANHAKCIWKLSKKNNFHVGDIYGVIYGKTHKLSFKNILLKMTQENNVPYPSEIKERELILSSDNNLSTKMYKNFPNYKGLFICLDKKPIGFTLFALRIGDIIEGVVDLLFILIDAPYRNKNYGTILMCYMIDLLKKNNKLIIVRIDNDIVANWYKKIEFITKDEVVAYEGNDYSIIRYINLEHIMNPSKETKLFYILN